MSKDFTAIYKILRFLDRNNGNEDYDLGTISAEMLEISEAKWEQLLIELQRNGYIDGIVYTKTLEDKFPHLAGTLQPRITLKGMEYLEENSFMKKAGRVIMGIKDFTK